MTEPEKNSPETAAPAAKAGGTKVWEIVVVVFTTAFILLIVIPKAVEVVRKTNELPRSRGNLGAIRSALSIYYGDMEGIYPAELPALTIAGKYLANVPRAKAPNYHSDTSVAHYGLAPDDTGGWWYNNVPSDANFGALMVNCTHTDSKGSVWTVY